jgi:Uma2 family endonuclease
MTTGTTTPINTSAVDDQPWPAQGEWTYNDYLRLPDDGRRYEIIEGVLYVTNAPGFEHQFVVTELLGELRNYVKEHKLGIVLPAPFEVHLSKTTRPVQPDIIFIRADNQPAANTQVFEGAPDLIVEVLSPSSVRTDRHIKFDAYEQAGVPEYWLVNPKTRSVEIHTRSGGEYALLGEFTGDEMLASKVLAGISIVTGSLFPPTH